MHFRAGILIAASLLLGVPPEAPAQEPVRRVTLDEALALFASNSLELRIARAGATEASLTARQAAAYPNPALTATHEALGSGAARYRESYLTVSQRLDWPWLASARRAAAGHRSGAAVARVAADSIRLAFDVRRAFGEAAAAEDLTTALAEATELVRRAERQASERAASGDISRYELRRLRVERLRYENELGQAASALGTARRRLGGMVLTGGSGEVAPSAPLPGHPPRVSLEVAVERAVGLHPAVAEAAALAAAARNARQAAASDRLPAPTITGGYKGQSDGFSGLFLGAGVSLPLFDRRGAALAAAKAQAEGSATAAALATRLAENDVRRTHAAYGAALARAALQGDSAEAEADALLRIARLAYEEGEMSLIELLDAVDAYRTSRAAAVEAGVNLWTSFFDLERAVGSPLADLQRKEGQ